MTGWRMPAEWEPHARTWFDDAVEILEAPLDDAWMRDIGPSFVLGADGTTAGVDWEFNGCGAQSWATWDKDAKVARCGCAELAVPAVTSPLVNEVGGIHSITQQQPLGRTPGHLA